MNLTLENNWFTNVAMHPVSYSYTTRVKAKFSIINRFLAE